MSPRAVAADAPPPSRLRATNAADDFISVRRVGAWAIPSLRRKPALVLLALFVAVGMAQASGFLLAGRGRMPPMILVFWGYLSGAVGSWLALPTALLAVVNAPSPAVGWRRFALTHVAGYIAFVGVHLTAIFSLRWTLRSSLSIDQVPRDLLAFIAYDAQNDVLVYSSIAGALALLYGWQERKAAALSASQLATNLAEARLESLTARLDPHFLFNGLNTVSAMMYEDLPRTERLLAALGEMLRDTLRVSGPLWSLEREWAHTLRYVEFVLARFEDRVQISCEANEEHPERYRVPRFAVQTLVENAIKHNSDRPEPLAVRVRVNAVASSLRIVVEDDGRGFRNDVADAAGQGSLARLREVLRLAYGEGARLECSNRSAGGALVCLELANAQLDELNVPAAPASERAMLRRGEPSRDQGT